MQCCLCELALQIGLLTMMRRKVWVLLHVKKVTETVDNFRPTAQAKCSAFVWVDIPCIAPPPCVTIPTGDFDVYKSVWELRTRRNLIQNLKTPYGLLWRWGNPMGRVRLPLVIYITPKTPLLILRPHCADAHAFTMFLFW